jgi:hypothetical protein
MTGMNPPARTIASLATDTSSANRRLQIDLWRRMSPLQKARAAAEITRGVQELALAGIRLQHPNATERECSLRLAILTLGRRLACQAYPEASELFEP